MKIKILPRDNKNRTQEQAIAYHNQRKERMMSMPDVWQVIKENNTEAIKELRKDWGGCNWQVTSTRIIYNQNNLSAQIIHNADSIILLIISLKEIYLCYKLID